MTEATFDAALERLARATGSSVEDLRGAVESIRARNEPAVVPDETLLEMLNDAWARAGRVEAEQHTANLLKALQGPLPPSPKNNRHARRQAAVMRRRAVAT